MAVQTAMELLVAAVEVEVSQMRIFELNEPTGFDVLKYVTEYQLTCYLATPSAVFLVVVTESDYPKVVDAWRRVTALNGFVSPSFDTASPVTELHASRSLSADILLVPFPLGIPAVGYAFELNPGCDQPVCARTGDSLWIHADADSRVPIQKAWSYRAIVDEADPAQDWSLLLGEGRTPAQWAMTFKVR